jgi:hypothetical protein
VSRSSIVAPKMMFVSSRAPRRTTSAASLTSLSERSSPPAIESVRLEFRVGAKKALVAVVGAAQPACA